MVADFLLYACLSLLKIDEERNDCDFVTHPISLATWMARLAFSICLYLRVECASKGRGETKERKTHQLRARDGDQYSSIQTLHTIDAHTHAHTQRRPPVPRRLVDALPRDAARLDRVHDLFVFLIAWKSPSSYASFVSGQTHARLAF